MARACVAALLPLALMLLLVVAASSEALEERSTVRQVTVVFRHGEQSPEVVYQTSLKSRWAEGLNQLTRLGKMHMFELGKWLRGRYFQFVGDDYHLEKLNVLSSSVERCIMSAQALLAGLMPPPEDERINAGLHWQPIPVRYSAPEDDGVRAQMILMKKPCPKMAQELNSTLSLEVAGELNKDYADLFKYLSENSGENITDFLGASKIYDTLNSEYSHGFEIPHWAKGIFTGMLQQVAAKGKAWFTNNAMLKRLRGGPLLVDITNHMKEKVKNPNTENGKMFIYAVHDQTIYDLMRSMGFSELMEVDFGSCVIFELHERKNNQWTVRVLFFNLVHLDEPKSLNVPGCGKECDLETFIQTLAPAIPKDFDEECDLQVFLHPLVPVAQEK